MTETRELSRDVYVAIAAALTTAFQLINNAMTAVNIASSHRLTVEWHELHGMMQLASVAQEMAERGRDQAPDPDAPIPYLPAACRHDDDSCTCIVAGPDDPRAPWGECIPPGALAAEGVYEIRDEPAGSWVLAEGAGEIRPRTVEDPWANS
jgi:hypothetical protein